MPPDAVGEIIARVVLAEKAGELFKPLFVRRGRASVAQPPGADESRAISLPLEQRGQGDDLGGKRLIEARVQVARLQPGHQRRPRRGILGAARVKTREADAFRRELVESGGFYFRLAVTTEIAVADVVRQNENDARPARGGRRHFNNVVRLGRHRNRQPTRQQNQAGPPADPLQTIFQGI